MLSYSDAAAEIMWHKITHAAHGYSQYRRSTNYSSKETITLSDGTKVKIASDDDDCSGSIRDTYLSLGVSVGDYTYTGNEEHGLISSGNFKLIPVKDAKNGDILLRESGHTEMCLVRDGKRYQGGFRIAENGTIHGNKGDQTGWESAYSAFNQNKWDKAFRCIKKREGEDSKQVPQYANEEDEMVCIFRPNQENYLMYYDGVELHPLSHPDEAEAIKKVYKSCTGKDIPMFELGDKKSPWATRFIAAVQRKYGKK